ncbi:MAG TPA: hypothetical protein VFU76_04530 [Terriglobales bacterium]|nr:hypothetical protein [Terriglobales bacterium]
MKRFLIALLPLFAALAFAQEESAPQPKELTVKRSATVNKVVVVLAQQGKTSVQLQCNEGLSYCKALEAGTYLMVELPPNRGTYDCANVRIYAKTANLETDERLGDYCLVEP